MDDNEKDLDIIDAEISEDISTDIIPVDIKEVNPYVQKTEYGTIIRKSSLCSICKRPDAMDINLARSRDHMSYNDISAQFKISLETIKRHFDNHYIIATQQQKILNVLEDRTQESKELITHIFDKNIDLIQSGHDILGAKAKRLDSVMMIINELTEKREIDALEDFEKGELIQMHKIASEIEDSMFKTMSLMDKKIFPYKKEDFYAAIVHYKLMILTKIVDQISIVFTSFEKTNPESSELIKDLRIALADKINKLEKSINKSGGEF